MTVATVQVSEQEVLVVEVPDNPSATTISFRVDEQTMAELRQLAGDGNLSDTIRDLIHAQYTARLYAQAARDASAW